MALIPVIVTTRYRAVFFGYMDEHFIDDDEIKLHNARNAMYWDGSQGGFLGLAKFGPSEGSHISAAAPWMVLKKVTAIIGVTPEAEKKWKETPDYIGKEEDIEDEK